MPMIFKETLNLSSVLCKCYWNKLHMIWHTQKKYFKNRFVSFKEQVSVTMDIPWCESRQYWLNQIRNNCLGEQASSLLFQDTYNSVIRYSYVTLILQKLISRKVALVLMFRAASLRICPSFINSFEGFTMSFFSQHFINL